MDLDMDMNMAIYTNASNYNFGIDNIQAYQKDQPRKERQKAKTAIMTMKNSKQQYSIHCCR